MFDLDKEIIKLENKKNTYNEKLKSILGKLNNKAFIEKAPDNVKCKLNLHDMFVNNTYTENQNENILSMHEFIERYGSD